MSISTSPHKPQDTMWSMSFSALIFIAVVINIGVSAIVPAMPIIMSANHFSEFFLTGAFVGLLVGRFIMSNVTGMMLVKRSPIQLLLIAFSLHAMTMAAFTGVESEIGFIALRCLEGVFEGIVSVTLQVMIISLTTPQDRGRKMGVFQSSYGLGFIIGPAIGGLALHAGGPRWVFISTAALMAFGLVWLFLVQGTLRRDMKVPPQTKPKFTTDFLKVMPLYSGAVLQRGLYVTLSILLPLFLVDKFSLEPYKVGLYFTGSAIVTSILMPWGGRVADTGARFAVTVASILVMGASILGMGLVDNKALFTVFYAMETIAFSFMVPCAMRIFGDAVQNHPQRGPIVGTASSSRELLNIALVMGIVPLYSMSHSLPWVVVGLATMVFAIPYLRAGRVSAIPVSAS